MTLSQLESQVARLIGLQSPADDPTVNSWIDDALNEAQLEIATDLQIPRYSTTFPGITGSFTLPPGTQSWGLISARDSTNGNPLAVIEPSRSLGFMYSTPGNPRFAVYDVGTGNVTLVPTPVAPVDVDIIYAAIPAQMVNPTDEPWNGQYQDHHMLVAMKAALLLHESDWSDPQRIKWVADRYSSRLAMFKWRIDSNKNAKPRSEVELNDFTGA